MTTILVYIDDGRVFEYECAPDNAREHAHAIVMTGYRSTNNETETLVHYPAHRIVKVKAIGGQNTKYPDKLHGT